MIYLDNAATAIPDINAINTGITYAKNNFYNPSAIYQAAICVQQDIADAKISLLKSIVENYSDYKLIFTSGGTESDNLAILSQNINNNSNIVTTKAEHSAIFSTLTNLKNQGKNVKFADVLPDGSVNIDSLLSIIDADTKFVSITHVCNETGAVNDIIKISKLIKSINKNIVFHSDGVQAYGKVPFKISNNVDMYSASAHKIGALKGCGFLAIKNHIKIKAYLHGGGQEYGVRSGTENVSGIISFNAAAKLKYLNLTNNYNKVERLNKIFTDNLDKDIFYIIMPKVASPYILSFSAVGLKGQVLQNMLYDNGVICGTGSSCSSKQPHSRILKECGYKKDFLDGVLRISFSADNSEEEASQAVKIINDTARKLRKIML